MSGICGIAFSKTDKKIRESELRTMGNHLGFDDQNQPAVGVYGSVGLGAHPFSTNLAGVVGTGTQRELKALSFYGSLFNLPELVPSADIHGSGLLHLMLNWYASEGMQFVQKLRGEFVLALWDGGTETLYLACDRFRVHPILYYHDQEKLVFASRMRCIVNCPVKVELSVNPAAVIDLVTHSFIPTPQTIFREVNKLPPGHLLRYRHGKLQLEPYWDISYLHQNHESEQSLAETLRSLFSESVGIRLRADGPVKGIGAFLSGGVDSTTVMSELTQLGKEPVKCFSIGFSEDRYNEIEYARMAARAFGAVHHEYFVSSGDVFNVLPMLIETFDEPFANASSIPTYFCAQLAKEHNVQVLYAGDGGDELFAGNERYLTQRIFQDYSRVPLWMRRSFIEPLVFALADRGIGIFDKGKNYIRRASIPYPDRLFAYNIFEEIPKDSLFDSGLLESVGNAYNPFGAYRSHYERAPAKTELERQLYMDLKLAITDNDLFKVTRMTERAGVNVRFPFLDYRLAEFAAAVPARTKMRGKNLRSFFKGAYAEILPSAIQTKKKHGFGLPIPIWLRTDRRLKEMMQDLVLSPTSNHRGYFQKKTLERLVCEHQSDLTGFYGTILWNLMILEYWNRMQFSKAHS